MIKRYTHPLLALVHTGWLYVPNTISNLTWLCAPWQSLQYLQWWPW